MDKPTTTHDPIRCFAGEAKPHEAFWKIKDAVEGEEPEIELYGYISEYSWFEDDVTPKKFKDDLYNTGKGGPITIRINSYGGDVIAASLMHTIIKDYPGKVTSLIDGVAASAATVVAVAGDVVKIQNVGYFMIHDPLFVFFLAALNIEDLSRLSGALQSIKEGIVNAYEAKTGLSRTRIANLMKEETWMDAQKALDLGFVDEIQKTSKTLVDLPANVAAVNAVQNFQHIPQALLDAFKPQNPPPEPTSSEKAKADEIQREAQILNERVTKILRKE